jgi:hypothetical protein
MSREALIILVYKGDVLVFLYSFRVQISTLCVQVHCYFLINSNLLVFMLCLSFYCVCDNVVFKFTATKKKRFFVSMPWRDVIDRSLCDKDVFVEGCDFFPGTPVFSTNTIKHMI